MNNETNKLIPDLRFPEFLNRGEWEEKAFEELFEIWNGRDYKHLDRGEIPVYGSGGYMLSVNDYLYDGESVCIGRKGTIDKPMFLSGKFWTVDTLFFTTSFKDCLPKYIFYVFQNINWLKHNEAGGIPSLSKANIYKISTVIPKPDEQQKIVSCLSSLDEVIAAHSQKLEALKEHKKGLMQNLFPQEGETVPKLRFPEFLEDGEWEEISLGDAVKFSSGGTPSKDNTEYWNGNIPWISASSMHDLVAEKSESNITDLAVKDGANITQKGNILILVRGSMLFKRVPICIAGRDVSFNQDVKALELKKEIDNIFFLYLLISNESDLLESVTSTGIGAGKLDTDGLKKLLLKMPLNKMEQQKIASCLWNVDEFITAEAEKIDQLKLHKKGLMQGLFPKSIVN